MDPSMDIMSKSDLAPEEQDTIRKSKESCTIFPANGSITRTEEAKVHPSYSRFAMINL